MEIWFFAHLILSLQHSCEDTHVRKTQINLVFRSLNRIFEALPLSEVTPRSWTG